MPVDATELQTRVAEIGVAAEPPYDRDQQAGAALVGTGSATARLLASELIESELIVEVSIDGMCGVY
jgi:mycofactocin precursor